MTQKVIDVVGTSKESFAKAAENAVSEAAKTVRGMKWARVAELEMELDGEKIVKYRTTAKSISTSKSSREGRRSAAAAPLGCNSITQSDSLRIFFRARFRAKACFTRRFAPGFR